MEDASEDKNKTPDCTRYLAAIKARDFELDLFWKRSLFFWGFISVGFTAVGAAHKQPRLQLAACSFVFVCSMVWTLCNRGSKFWYEHWEGLVNDEELKVMKVMKVDEPLFRAHPEAPSRNEWWGGRRFSVSRLATALSD